MRRLIAVEGCEKLRGGEIEPEKRHHQEQQTQVVEVNLLQIFAQPIDPADQGHRHDQRRDPREDRPDDEVGAEDRAVPHRLDRHGEDEADDRVNRDGDGDDHDRHDAYENLQHAMLLRGSGPAECECAV